MERNGFYRKTFTVPEMDLRVPKAAWRHFEVLSVELEKQITVEAQILASGAWDRDAKISYLRPEMAPIDFLQGKHRPATRSNERFSLPSEELIESFILIKQRRVKVSNLEKRFFCL